MRELVRQPRQRMPVAGVAARQRPKDALRAQAVLELFVVRDVNVVVVIHESVVPRLAENQEHGGHQHRAREEGSRQRITAPPARLE